MRISRRAFISTVAAAGAGCVGTEPAAPAAGVGAAFDFHVHLFGQGDGGTGCWISPRQRKHWNYPFFQKLLGLSDNGRMDQDYVAELVRQLRSSSTRQAVLLGQDGRYDKQGRLDLAATDGYTPNGHVFRVAREHEGLFVPCPSINPRRRDALDELDHCAEQGARVIKVHPPAQDVDPAEERFRPFYRRVAQLRIVLMVHTGSEYSTTVADPTLGDPARLLPALEEGCTVVAAHAGMGSFLDERPFRGDFFKNLVALAKRFPNLYCDTAVLTSIFRWRNIPQLVSEPALTGRIIYASDWPFTSNALVFWNRLRPSQLLALGSEGNLFERDFRLKAALGLPADAFERGARLLAPPVSPGTATADQWASAASPQPKPWWHRAV